MTTEADKILLDAWNDPGQTADLEDLLFRHFETFGRWDWKTISQETLRVWHLLFGGKMDSESVGAYVLTAAIAHASEATYAVMAAALGVDNDALQSVLEDWSANQDSPPTPISAEELVLRCAENQARRDEQ